MKLYAISTVWDCGVNVALRYSWNMTSKLTCFCCSAEEEEEEEEEDAFAAEADVEPAAEWF